MSETAAPRRLRAADIIDSQKEIIERLTEPRKPASLAPSFKVAQVKGVGGAMVHEWEVHVPVCDEYRTSGEAFKALLSFSERLKVMYPPPTTNGDKP